MQEIANVLGIPDEAAKYVNILKRGKKAYHTLLWNGNLSNLASTSFFSVYNVDEGAMAAGRCALWQDTPLPQCLSISLLFTCSV